MQLAGTEAAFALAGRALQASKVRAALQRAADHAVGDAVERVALLHHRAVDQAEVGGGEAHAVALGLPANPHRLHHQVGHRIGRGHRADRVEIVRIAKSRHQALTAPGRARVPEGILRRRAVECLYQPFGRDGRDMDRVMAEVDQLLRVADGPFGSQTIACVAGVGSRRGVIAADIAAQLGEADRAGPEFRCPRRHTCRSTLRAGARLRS